MYGIIRLKKKGKQGNTLMAYGDPPLPGRVIVFQEEAAQLERVVATIEYIALRLAYDEDQKGKILELLHGTPYVPFERNDGG